MLSPAQRSADLDRLASEELDVLVISAAREMETVRRALRGGIVHYLMKPFSREDLRERLKAAAIRDRDLDEEIARDWLAVDQETWQQLDDAEKRQTGRSAGKSISRRSTQR